ncbi:hypothetical protein [Evansella cellulosilytica]|uniref:Uncharacterized protein n=1 Tax=Evansella cellulosilytica (strain ATCC 21833 / DSM 2522 / FERM P-1141 / JCM 9156 / N-4) TaxID=649639 RepID=E6TUZ4_EVAC2|nr:hypothetical protein [Evansella cellulosilytica]ADU28577.1 hypothetical protein Bcell_0290 [Evansella cellulosilytica DSM 2522]
MMKKESFSLMTSGLLLIGSIFFLIGSGLSFFKALDSYNGRVNGNSMLD